MGRLMLFDQAHLLSHWPSTLTGPTLLVDAVSGGAFGASLHSAGWFVSHCIKTQLNSSVWVIA